MVARTFARPLEPTLGAEPSTRMQHSQRHDRSRRVPLPGSGTRHRSADQAGAAGRLPYRWLPLLCLTIGIAWPAITLAQTGAPAAGPASTAAALASRRAAMWLSPVEIRRLPIHGAAWDQVYREAYDDWDEPDLADQNHDHNTQVLAGALVAVRMRDDALALKVKSHLRKVPGTEAGGRTLSLARNLHAYIIAAGLVQLQDDTFDRWLDAVRFQDLGGKTLVSTHQRRANNWGTHAGASRIAAAIYLDDRAELERSARVFAGWLGDRTQYTGFKFGDDLSWHADPARPVGINPLGATRQDRLIDGFLPDDLRRGGPFQWPPVKTNYPWAALNGVVIQAELLHRQGYDAWNWSDQAVRRSVAALERLGWYVTGEDEEWLVHVVNRRHGTHFRTPAVAAVGKNFGWTDWTHHSPGQGEF